jgi:hypothetical protein
MDGGMVHIRDEGWKELKVGCVFGIGSGMVESGCKQYEARFSGPGMRWSRAGIERLISIRGAIMGDQFDKMWRKTHNSPQN